MIFQGTSMASPHVAGAVARYLSRSGDNPPPTPAEIKEMMAFDATYDKITLGVGENPSDRLTTPNRLLYMTCGSPSSALNGVGVIRLSLVTGALMLVAVLVGH